MTTLLPRHVAIVMDGNGRWAHGRFLSRIAGHKAGVSAVDRVVKHCASLGIPVLSLFAFSSENWSRPREEVGALMELLFKQIRKEMTRLHENNIKIHFIGNREPLSASLKNIMTEAENLTQHNTRMTLCVAVNYGGRWDIIQACKRIVSQVLDNKICLDDIDEPLFREGLALAQYDEPDLFIRTSGELRISNFFLWDLAYSEFYFTPVLWPDFTESVLDEAIAHYQLRQRRFGGLTQMKESQRA